MARGKQTCKILKEIRRQIAAANDIEYVTSECRYKGDCLGTCPKCEAEVHYLEQQLRARTFAGKAVALAGISAAALGMFMPLQSGAQVQDVADVPLPESARKDADTITVNGVVACAEGTAADGTVLTEPLAGAIIVNRRTGQGTYTNINGEFCLLACIGDSLEASYVGCETQVVVVTEKNMTILLSTQGNIEAVIAGGVTFVPREENHYIDLDVVDENGNRIDASDVSVERIWIDENGEADTVSIYIEYFDEAHPCRIYWNHVYGMTDENGNPLKEATLRIEAEDYDDPVVIKVKYPKHTAKRTIKFKRKKTK